MHRPGGWIRPKLVAYLVHEFKIDNKSGGGKVKQQRTECVWLNY